MALVRARRGRGRGGGQAILQRNQDIAQRGRGGAVRSRGRGINGTRGRDRHGNPVQHQVLSEHYV